MSLKTLSRAILILFASAGILSAAPVPAAKDLPAHCNRACLIGTMNNYFAALVAHDPSQVPLSPQLEFVENITPMHAGDGLWKTASAVPTTFKIIVPDPVSEEVGSIAMMQESGKPIQVAIRLKVHDGKIVVAEHLVVRTLNDRGLKNLNTPRPIFFQPVPPAERDSRADMLKIGLSYYEAIVSADRNNAPFADDCVRRENGMQTTGNPPPATPGGRATLSSLGCAAQLKTGVMDYIKRIDPRRVMIADPEMGLAFGLSQFRHPMDSKTVKITGVPGTTEVPVNFAKPFDSINAHIFKVYGGKLHQIEAMGFQAPYDTHTGWENFADHGR